MVDNSILEDIECKVSFINLGLPFSEICDLHLETLDGKLFGTTEFSNLNFFD